SASPPLDLKQADTDAQSKALLRCCLRPFGNSLSFNKLKDVIRRSVLVDWTNLKQQLAL
ncbi:hypothetical protein GOODEAATRI_008858, partial [Goodea atripinnis]